MTSAEVAILASTVSSAFSLATLIISRIKCYYERNEDGCHPKCACMDHPILSVDHEVEIAESMLSETLVLIISRKHSCSIVVQYERTPNLNLLRSRNTKPSKANTHTVVGCRLGP